MKPSSKSKGKDKGYRTTARALQLVERSLSGSNEQFPPTPEQPISRRKRMAGTST